MAIVEIKRAAERHLATLTPSIPTGWEGVSFTPPASLYQRVQFVVQSPEDPVLGVGFHRERISMQVFVAGPTNKGTSEILAQAELIRQLFKKGTVLVENNVKIHVLTTPQIAGTSTVSDKAICPVIINLVAEVYSY